MEPRHPRQNFMDSRHRRQNVTHTTHEPTQSHYPHDSRTHVTHNTQSKEKNFKETYIRYVH